MAIRIDIAGISAGGNSYSSKNAIDTVKQTIKLTGALSIPKSEEETLNQRKVVLLKCGIVRLPLLPPQLPPGSEIKLVREPYYQADNKWSTLVETQTGDVLGCLPMNKDQSVARLIDAGKTIKGIVLDKDDPDISKAKLKKTYGEDFRLPIAVYMEMQERTKDRES